MKYYIIKLVLFVAILLIANVTISSADSPPPLPNTFGGSVKFVNSSGQFDAPTGTLIKAFINNVPEGAATIITAGKYIIDVSGTYDDDGENITFVVNNLVVEQKAVFNINIPPPRTLNLIMNQFSDSASPLVTNATVNQSDIPDDTDNLPLWGETAQLNVTVTDESNISSVTINLSEIGGSSAKPMLNIGDNVYSTTTNASAGTPPKLYNLTVNATDICGNSNTSVRIPLKVMKNGDTTGNNVVNIGDALRLANNVSYPGNPTYYLSSIYVAEVTGNGVVNIGDALRLANNVSYPGNPAYILR